MISVIARPSPFLLAVLIMLTLPACSESTPPEEEMGPSNMPSPTAEMEQEEEARRPSTEEKKGGCSGPITEWSVYDWPRFDPSHDGVRGLEFYFFEVGSYRAVAFMTRAENHGADSLEARFWGRGPLIYVFHSDPCFFVWGMRPKRRDDEWWRYRLLEPGQGIEFTATWGMTAGRRGLPALPGNYVAYAVWGIRVPAGQSEEGLPGDRYTRYVSPPYEFTIEDTGDLPHPHSLEIFVNRSARAWLMSHRDDDGAEVLSAFLENQDFFDYFNSLPDESKSQVIRKLDEKFGELSMRLGFERPERVSDTHYESTGRQYIHFDFYHPEQGRFDFVGEILVRLLVRSEDLRVDRVLGWHLQDVEKARWMPKTDDPVALPKICEASPC